ncbi:MAG: Nif11-like leader peptide family natural product precursor [Oculatellaceae cyanobacterium Prado106]|nr:Nif11-like leader peptide family natural product precursor [Oculatellaceae cyanobacterium Prado106]
MSKQVKQFHQLITTNPSLQEKFRQVPDRASFVAMAVKLGAEHGYSFTAIEVETYINSNFLTLMKQFS